MEQELKKGNELIAEAGGWHLETHFPPHIYERGSEVINSISFHKAKMLGKLIEVVDLLEQKHNLYIIIKRKECVIQEMHLTSHRTIISKEGKTKQEAIWLAVVEFLDTDNS